MNILAIEIGGTKLQLALGDAGGRIAERRTAQVPKGADAAAIRAMIADGLPELAAGVALAGVGAGFGGPVDWETGRICRSHQIEGWSEFDLAGWLARLAGAPAWVDNDANVAALGEARHGAAAGFRTAFYVTLGSGVGGGLVVDRRIYHGAKPGESEIGHVRLSPGGATVESRCSGWAVDARIRESAAAQPEGRLARAAAKAPGAEAKVLAAAWHDGDPTARALLAEVAADLGFALSHAVHLMHPEVVVLGGGLAGWGEPLRAGVESALRAHVMAAFAPGVAVRLSGLGADAVPVGALCLAADGLGVAPGAAAGQRRH